MSHLGQGNKALNFILCPHIPSFIFSFLSSLFSFLPVLLFRLLRLNHRLILLCLLSTLNFSQTLTTSQPTSPNVLAAKSYSPPFIPLLPALARLRHSNHPVILCPKDPPSHVPVLCEKSTCKLTHFYIAARTRLLWLS